MDEVVFTYQVRFEKSLSIKSANAQMHSLLTHTLSIRLSLSTSGHAFSLYFQMICCREDNPISFLKDKTTDRWPLSVQLCFIVFKKKQVIQRFWALFNNWSVGLREKTFLDQEL